MLTYKSGSIFDENVDALVNPVNCVGISGKGLALQFKKKFPDNYEFYYDHCQLRRILPGEILIYKRLEKPYYIYNMATKDHFKHLSRLGWIQKGLANLSHDLKRRPIKSIAIPAIGCGLGQLRWQDVKLSIEVRLGTRRLRETDIRVFYPND